MIMQIRYCWFFQPSLDAQYCLLKVYMIMINTKTSSNFGGIREIKRSYIAGKFTFRLIF